MPLASIFEEAASNTLPNGDELVAAGRAARHAVRAARIIEADTRHETAPHRKRGDHERPKPHHRRQPRRKRQRRREKRKPVGSDTFRAPSYGKDAAQAAVNATIIDEGRVSKKKPNRIGGAVQTAIGGAIMLVGVPMLILPGPGLLAIGGGAVIAGNGIKKVLGK